MLSECRKDGSGYEDVGEGEKVHFWSSFWRTSPIGGHFDRITAKLYGEESNCPPIGLVRQKLPLNPNPGSTPCMERNWRAAFSTQSHSHRF